MRRLRYASSVILFIFLAVLLWHSTAFGRILHSWEDEDAYKPNPILFLHGFAMGNSGGWNYIISELNQYFNDYGWCPISLLETIDFDDPNGSIDTYGSGKLNPQGNSQGWADKVEDKVNNLSNLFKFKGSSLKLSLICHSMGGLAAREYLTNSKYTNSYTHVDKLITIGTPHVGSPIANIKKIENAATGMHKYVWDIPRSERIQTEYIEISDDFLKLLKGPFHLDPEGEAVKDMAVKSPFLTQLNARGQPSNFKNYALYGEELFPFNILFAVYYPSEPWTCGDGIVPRDSQIGVDIMTNYPDTTPRKVWSFESITKIAANHFNELESKDAAQKILAFLDSAKPELEITSPNPGQVTEIQEAAIHIQGKVYKEYFPANSQLIITITRQEDGEALSPQVSFLKPSDLWLPNNPGSPVAEFDEVVNFPGNGIYKLSCQIKNPAGIVSEIKNTMIKVSHISGIIVHCHNPEGKEINSIAGGVEIFNNNTSIGYGAYDAQTHNKLISILSGTHTIKAKFNGMTKEKTITLNPNETKVLTFVFERTKFDLTSLFSFTRSIPFYHPGPAAHYWPILDPPYFCLRWHPSGDRLDSFVDIHSTAELFDSVSRTASMTGVLTVSGDINSYSASANIDVNWDITMNSVFYNLEIGKACLTNILINIPIQENFAYWYVQLKEIPTERAFSYVSVRAGEFIEEVIIPYQNKLKPENNFCYTTPFSAKYNYTNMFISPDYLSYSSYTRIPINSNSWSLNRSWPSEVLLEEGSILEMSSVPYDLTGSGV